VYGLIFGTTLDLIQERVIAYDAVPNRYGFTYAFGHYLKGDVPSSWLPFFQDHGPPDLRARNRLRDRPRCAAA
jgi:hypothetical protein